MENGESKLIDMFLCYPELHQKLKELFLIISKNHEYFSKPSTTDNEKAAAAENAALFTKKLPFYFPEVPITRKMHLMGFVISPLIATDKHLKLEQMGERLHAIWNLLHRTRFCSVRNGNERLMNMFIEYENSLYVKK